MLNYDVQKNIFFRNTKLFSSGHGSFLTLSAEGRGGGTPVHHGASVGLGRAPWRMLWAFKDAKSGKSPRDRFATS